jgi:hypothetical protein
MKSRWLAVAVVAAALVWTWPAMPDEPSETAKSSPRSMLGTKSVSEWCRDWFQNALPGGRDPEVTLQSTERVARGGWASSPAEMCRSAFRQGNDPWPRLSWMGFRVALSSVREADAETRGTADK